jgi:hypothetical protein
MIDYYQKYSWSIIIKSSRGISGGIVSSDVVVVVVFFMVVMV